MEVTPLRTSNQMKSLSNRCTQINPISYEGKKSIPIQLRVFLKNTFSFKSTLYERECNRFSIHQSACDVDGYHGEIRVYMNPAFIDKISEWWNPAMSISNRVGYPKDFLDNDEEELDFIDYFF